MRRLVSDDSCAGCDPRLGKRHAVSLTPEYVRQDAPAALAQRNDAAPCFSAMCPQAPIDAVNPGIGRPDMAADVRSIDLHSRIQHEIPRLKAQRLPQLVGEHEGGLVGHVHAT